MEIIKESTSIEKDFKETLKNELNKKEIKIDKSIINNIQYIIRELDVNF